MLMNSIHKIVATCVACVGATLAAPAIWNGTADVSWYESSAQAYNLTTAEQLAGLAKLVNQGTSSFEGKTITLGMDIFLNDTTGAGSGAWASVSHTEWTPIGTSSRPFKGEFDGLAGKKVRKIYGLYINNASKDYAGLFGNTSNVKISNLDVLVGQITAHDNVGGLVGYATGGSITNVHAEIKVTGNNHTGGLVGYTTGTISASSVKENVVGQDSVGGLVGVTTTTILGTSKSSSYFIGDVTGRKYVGGLAGSGESISKCYVEGSVTGDSSYVGGVIGYASGTIDSTYHIGGDVSGFGYVGGLAGYVAVAGSISYSHAEGKITALGSYVGGVVGYSRGSIDSVYHTNGDVTGSKHYVGGLVGYGFTISKSYAIGVVKGDSNYVGGVAGYSTKIISSNHRGGDVGGYGYVGGLVGRIDSTVSNSYSLGNVLATGSYVGGLIGLSLYRYGSSVNQTVTWDAVISSHSSGKVKGVVCVGGLVGLDSVVQSGVGTISHRIYNSYAIGDVEGGSSVGGVIGKFNSNNNKYAWVSVEKSYHAGGNVYGTSYYVGGVAGSIRGVIQSSKHYGGDVSGDSFVGGLVGAMDSTVTDSYSEGNVTGTGNYVGGLIGRSFYEYERSANMTIMGNSYSIGNIKGNNFVGGLIGLDSLRRKYYTVYSGSRNIKSSYSYGNVEGSMYVGGIVGKSNYGSESENFNDSIISSYHKGGSVIGQNDYVGGVAGYVANSYIDSCYHEGGNVSGRSYVAGLVGYTTAIVRNSYSKASVDGARHYVGGLVGYGSVISKSYAEGVVNGDSNNVGGVAGCASVSIDSTYHKGGNVYGNNNVGGVVGLALRQIDASVSRDSTYVIDSYSIGNVEGHNSVGGVIGNDSLYRVVTNNQNISNILGFTKKAWRLYSRGEVKGNNFVGGVVGKQSVGSDSPADAYCSFNIRLSKHSEGAVSADSNYVGGVVGVVVGGVSGYSRGSIDSSYHEGGNVSGRSYVAGIAGYITGSVSNSHSIANVAGAGSYVGGLIGNGSSVSRSYAEGSVIGNSSYVGGVAGRVSGTIDSSYHVGGDIIGYGYVGGLVGYGSTIVNSHSDGNVMASRDYAGGLAGYSSSKVRNSNATASFVKGRNFVGGLSGYVTDSIDVSYFEGDSVTGIYQVGGLAGYAGSAVDSSYSTAHVKGDDNVGGLIGSAYGDVSNSYALGNVVGDVDNSSAGNDNLGGLVGYQYSGSISKSLALGSVSGTTKLGGLAGRFDGTTISQSYANGDVTGSYYGDPADEVGNYYIGGLVGYAKGTLEETYASGVVKGMEDEPVYTGCIVGYVNGSLNITKSYYDKTKCSLGVDGGEETATVTGSPDKTTTEMQTQSTFVNWDFVDTWKIYENTYPFLKIFTNSLTNAVVTTASLENIVYDGSAKTPIVTSVELFGETLTYGSDYTVAYKNNVDAGTATINVCGVNPYGGCKAINFVINAAAIVPTIASIEDVTYSGVALTPEISVYNGGTLLTDADYTVEYADNLNAGTASVTVTLKGNYSGSATKTFTIKKATPVITQNPTASNVINGQTLASSELTGGSADVEGAFVWQAPETVPTLENDGYIAVFVPTDTLNYDSVGTTVPVEVLDYVYVAVHVGDETLDSAVVIKGGNYTLPNVPDSVGHDFVGLYKGNAIVGNPGDVIVLNENTVIEAIYEAKTFAITFVNGDAVLQSENTAYGTLPEYRGDTPAKTATVQYTYTFKGWNPAIASVTGAATYTAVFDSTVNKYMVTFKDGETVLQSGEVAYGTVPTAPAVTLPENTAQYTYSFGGWDSEVVAVTGPATYTAVINRTLNKYEVVFKDYDGSVLKSAVEYDYGTSADNVVKPSDPTRESTAQYTYTFKGWNPSIGEVTGAAIYTAEYDSTVRSYEIAFVNGNSTLQSGTVEYGQTPIYSGEAPTKTATAQYTYTFKGWNPAIASVTGAATYTAVFDSTVNKYTVTFKDGETVLQSGEVAYGTVPTAPAVTLPENTAQYTYSFGGWDSEIVAVTGPATYTAVINRTLNKYEVVFKDYDGSVLKSAVEYDYGTSAASIAKPANPTRGSTAQYTYTFKGWNPSIADVTGAAVYTAEYDSTVRSYEITFVNGSRTLQSGSVEYGQTPVYSGAAPTKTATAQYTYTFKGWNPAIASVTGAATYTAVFDSTVNKYTVTFKDGETVLQSGEVAYGTVPTAPAVTLPENTAQYSYSFDGWDSEIVAVTGSATYTAVINRTLNKYEVVFKDYDGSVLKSAVEYDYGTSAASIAKPANPTRGSTAQYTYTFKGWNPSIADVTGAAVYTAEYDSTVRSYEIAFVNGSRTLQSGSVEYGQTPVYSGAAPTKTATAQYTYTFKGWNPAIASVTGAATYTAVFDSTVNKYTVTFKDGETVLQSGEVAYGTVPTAPAVTLPENTAQYTYSFGGWDSEVVAVTGSATYTAVINRTLNKYEVVFKDYDGSVLKAAVEYDYGTSAASIAKPANPTRVSTAQYTYTFKGWNPSIAAVTRAAVYTAEYDSTVRSYEIAFVNGNSTLQTGTVEYGQTPVYSGETPTRTATAQYTYTFKGWNPAIASVTGAATYTAVFDSTVIKYIVTFMEGTTVLQSSEVAYGTMPIVPKVTLPENTAQYTYSLSWDKEIVSVTEATTYNVIINRDISQYAVIFRDFDGILLASSLYDYGTTSANIVVPKNPVRANSAEYSYTFKGWTPKITDVTSEAVYIAEYDSTKTSATIDSTDNGGDTPSVTRNEILNNELRITSISRNIQIAGAKVGSAYVILDMQGRVLKKGRVESANFNIPMAMAGNYLVRVGSRTQRINIK